MFRPINLTHNTAISRVGKKIILKEKLITETLHFNGPTKNL